jgi:hypothetical protein
MTNRGPLQTPFDDAVAPTPSGEPSGGGVTGGFELGVGTEKETPNSVSGLPAQLTTVNVGEGSAPGSQVPMPSVDTPGTFHP